MPVSNTQKRQIKEEAGFRCAIPTCNATSPLDIHHIVYQCNGGTDENTNLICLCKNCHGRVHNNEINQISIRGFKRHVQIISANIFPHEIRYLEALFIGEDIELDSDAVLSVRRLERHNYINIVHIQRDNIYRLSLTRNGRELIQ